MRPDEPQARREFSLANLFTDLSREVSTLLRQEAQLIKAEMSEKFSDAKAGATEIIVGGAILLGGFFTLLLAAVSGVDQVRGAAALDYPWLAALIVGTVVALIGAVVLFRGSQNLKAGNLTPERSGQSLRRDTEVLKEQFNK